METKMEMHFLINYHLLLKEKQKTYTQKFRKLLSAVTNLKTSTREKYTAHLNAFQKDKKTMIDKKNNSFQTNTFAIYYNQKFHNI